MSCWCEMIGNDDILVSRPEMREPYSAVLPVAGVPFGIADVRFPAFLRHRNTRPFVRDVELTCVRS